MATHSSVLAWRVPWTEEPGGLQSMGSQGSDMTKHTTEKRQWWEILHKKYNIRVMHWGEIEDPEMTSVGLHFTLDCC